MNFHPRKLFRHFFRNILAGIPVLLPLVATIYIFVQLFDFADSALPNILNGIVPQVPARWIPGVGFLVILLSTYATGMLTKVYLGRLLIHLGNRLITKIPLVNKVYVAVQQILDAVFSGKKKAFEKVVMAEYPRKGCYTVGFLTCSKPNLFSKPFGRDFVTVFLPTAPTPTQGFVVVLHTSEVIELDVPVEMAFKFIMSAGIINPEKLARNKHLYDIPASPKQWNWMENLAKRKSGYSADPRD